MSFNVRDLMDAGRGHLIPDPYGDGQFDWPEQDEEWEDDDRDVVEARIDAGDGDE